MLICKCMRATGSPAEISNHSYELARLVYSRLLSWQHSNGQRLAELYHDTSGFKSSKTQGPIVNFNLLRADGSHVGFTQVTHVLLNTCYSSQLLLYVFVGFVVIVCCNRYLCYSSRHSESSKSHGRCKLLDGLQTKRCWYMPRKLGAYWKQSGTGSIDGLGMFSGMTTYSMTL